MKIKIVSYIVLITLLSATALSSCGGSGDPAKDGEKDAAPDVTSGEPEQGAPETDKDATQQTERSTGADVTLIGDSVALGAVDQIEELMPDIDMLARTDRSLSGEGLELLKQEEADGKLREIVVLSLGVNSLEKKDLDKAIEIIGDRQIVFVNAYIGTAIDYVTSVNDIIKAAADENENNFTLVDWFRYVKDHPDTKLAADKCHLTESSAAAYADLIYKGAYAAEQKLAA